MLYLTTVKTLTPQKMDNNRKLEALERLHKMVMKDVTSTESIKMDMYILIGEFKQQILNQIEEDDSNLHQGRPHAREIQ